MSFVEGRERLTSGADGSGRGRIARALSKAAVAWCVAAVLVLHFHLPAAGVLAGGLGTLLLLLGLFLPSLYLLFEKGSRAIGDWAAVAMTWLLLMPLFYLVFVPGRIALALSGGDPLQRRKDKSATTYWCDWKHSQDPESYLRQY